MKLTDYKLSLALSAFGALSLLACASENTAEDDINGSTGSVGNIGTGATSATGGVSGMTGGSTGSGGVAASGGDAATGGGVASGGSSSGGASSGGATGTGGGPNENCTSTEADEKFSFFVTSYHHIEALSGSPDGFGGDLRYNGAATGLEGADAICQEIASRVCFGHKTWKAYLSTSQTDAIDRIGTGPWYDHAGELVANDTAGLVQGDRPAGGCCDLGIRDELGVIHDGKVDDDHDTLTGSTDKGVYAGFSCEDWTSTTATGSGGGGGPGGGSSGPMCGHSWPAMSGQGWSQAHSARGCGAGVNFEQNGPGTGTTVGAGGGYGGIYCFAL